MLSKDLRKIKKLISILLCMITILAMPLLTVKASSASYFMGDFDFDGEVTAADARQILRVSSKLYPNPLPANWDRRLLLADLDADNQITAADARIALRMSSRLDPLMTVSSIATVNNYYDRGYNVFYNETETVSKTAITGYTNAVAKRYLELVGLKLVRNDITYFNSAIDICKNPVTAGNINKLCAHPGNTHTDATAVYNDFNGKFAGSNKITNAYWSAHRILFPGRDENTSFSQGTCIFMHGQESSFRVRNSQGILMHELNHQYEVPDHYHEEAILNDITSCKRIKKLIGGGSGLCSEEDCNNINGTINRPDTCVMNISRQNITNSKILCSGCKKDLEDHLAKSHHKIS